MDSALAVHRLQFAFTVTFHYIFPQLTMGLAVLIVILKTLALKTNQEHYDNAARFWARIFGINFVIGVVTGIPMEFQFGSNWARFSKVAGGVIGQPLAMEGVFSFFLESSFLGLFLFGEKRMSRLAHWSSAVLVWLGSWLSGFFIVAADAWMQHPVAYTQGPDGVISLTSIWGLLLNPWVFSQYLHTMLGAVATGAFAMASLGAFYTLAGEKTAYGRTFVRLGLAAALFASALLLVTGDAQGRDITQFQPITLAATEGLFQTEQGAPLAILGQPDTASERLDNPLVLPRLLSFLTYRHWSAQVKGLRDYPRELWPDNIPLLYYSFHIMLGLGTMFLAVTAICTVWLLRGRLFQCKPLLWTLMLALPFPYIANTAGWMTAELGRQPWLVYGVMRTAGGESANVSAGNALFSLIGFLGIYAFLAALFLIFVLREIQRGPEWREAH